MKKISILMIASFIFCSALMFAQLTNPKVAGEIQMNPANPNISNIITFRVRVLVKYVSTENLYLKGSIDGNKIFLKNFIGTTPAGYDEYIEFQWYSPTAGTHTVTVDLDPDNLIAEEVETDNHLEKTFSVSSSSLTVTNNTLQKVEPKVNPKFNIVNNIPVNVYVKPEIRRGVTTTPTSYIWSIYGYVKSEFHDMEELTVEIKAASSTANCSKRVTIKNLKAGEYKKAGVDCELPMGMYITVISADPDNVLKEKNRSDNVRIRNLSLEYVK